MITLLKTKLIGSKYFMSLNNKLFVVGGWRLFYNQWYWKSDQNAYPSKKKLCKFAHFLVIQTSLEQQWKWWMVQNTFFYFYWCILKQQNNSDNKTWFRKKWKSTFVFGTAEKVPQNSHLRLGTSKLDEGNHLSIWFYYNVNRSSKLKKRRNFFSIN